MIVATYRRVVTHSSSGLSTLPSPVSISKSFILFRAFFFTVPSYNRYSLPVEDGFVLCIALESELRRLVYLVSLFYVLF